MAIKPDATKVNRVNFTIWEGTNIVTDIPFLKQIAGLKLYPNPTSGHITIKLINPLNQSATVSIYSISGQLVYQNEFRNENQIRIDLSDRKPGIYMVKISVGETQLTDKLILK